MAEDFTDQVVIVTGAASGIGLEQAKLFFTKSCSSDRHRQESNSA